MPESPRYCLVTEGRYQEAVKAINDGAKDNKATLPEGQLEKTVDMKKGRAGDLLKPDYQRTTIIWCVVYR